MRKTTMDLTEGPILKKLLLYAFPLILSSLISHLYTTADTVMVGRFVSAQAMAAVGATSQPLNLVNNFFLGVSLGVNVTCGNLKGAKKDRELIEAMHTCVLMGMLSGIFITLVGIPVSQSLLIAMDTPQEILTDAILYIRIRFAGAPVMMVGRFCAKILYGLGDTRTPTIVSIISGVVNVVFNAVFLLVFRMGVAGVALATILSATVEAVVYLYLLFSPRGQYRLSFSKLRLRWNYVRDVLTVGIPSGFSNSIFSISNIMLQSCVNGFGYVVIAGNTAANDVVSYANLVIQNMGSACVAFTAQCYGARNFARVDKLVKTAVPLCLGVVLIMCVPLTLFGKDLLRLYNSDPEVAEMGYYKMMFSCWGYLANGPQDVFSGCVRGFRKANIALLCNLGGTILPRLVWIWFVVPMMNTPTMLYMIYPISWFITAVLMGCSFFHYRRKLTNTLLPEAT